MTEDDDVLTLVMDTSSQSAACGIYRGTRPLAECFLLAGLTHSQTMGCMLEQVLRLSRTEPKAVSQVAVTNGPGSFTGLRIGVSAALGYALAAEAEIVGVSSLEAAAQNAAHCGGRKGVTVCAVMDARRGQVYTAAFRAANGRLERLCEDRTAAAEEIIARYADETVVYVGDGAELCYDARKDILAPELRYIRPAGILRCVREGHTRPADRLYYLRLPQAERERLERERRADNVIS